MKKAKILIILIFTTSLIGCTDIENVNPNNDFEKTNKFSISELMDWENAKIVDIGFYPKFEEAGVVQNDNYCFYPQDGTKIVRIDKSNKEQKVILELAVKKGKDIGVQICLANDMLLIEYEGDLYECNFDGEEEHKIISSKKLRKQISSMIDSPLDREHNIIQGMKFYQGDLYLFLSSFNIMKLDLVTKEFVQVAQHTDEGCFFNDELFYIDFSAASMYKVNLSNLKRKCIRGKDKERDAEKNGFYYTIMEVNNQIYYTKRYKHEAPSLYELSLDGNDKKIYEFPGLSSDFIVANNDSTSVVAEYYDHVKEEKYLQVYNIKESVAKKVKLPENFGTLAFLVDDMAFYSKSTSDDKYLLGLELK